MASVDISTGIVILIKMVTKQTTNEEQWTMAVAKARLSEVIQRAQTAPQTITRNGTPMAVLVSAREWDRKTARHGTLADFLRASPLNGSDLDVERPTDIGRDVGL